MKKLKPKKSFPNKEARVKTGYMRMALGMCEIGVNDHTAELLWRLFEELQELGDDFSVRDATTIKCFMEEKTKRNTVKEKARREKLIADIVGDLPETKKTQIREQLTKLLILR